MHDGRGLRSVLWRNIWNTFLSNPHVGNELNVKDNTESDISASYLYMLLNIVWNDTLKTILYDKCDDFNKYIVRQTLRSGQLSIFVSLQLQYYSEGK
jgi:hypothetical protein